jgi:hypothetical protein
MSKQLSNEQLHKIADDLIFGVGGLKDYKEHELAMWNGKEGLEEAYWVLKCIATNKKYQKLLNLCQIKKIQQ